MLHPGPDRSARESVLRYGPACIVVIDKENAHARKGIFMVNASAGFMKDGPKNRLRDMDIHKIVAVFDRRLEYVLVHELVHLTERTHNARFVALMNRFMPNWQVPRAMLNRLPVRQASWSY